MNVVDLLYDARTIVLACYTAALAQAREQVTDGH